MPTHRLSPSRAALWFVVAGAVLSTILVADSLLFWRYLLRRPPGPNSVLHPVWRGFFFVAMAPIVIWMARRIPLDTGRPWRTLTIHLLLACASGMASVELFAWLLYGHRPWHPHMHWTVTHVPQWVLFYAVVAGGTAAFDSHARSRARERQATELRAQLAESQLRALKHQLHPHFVFNTLQAVSTLMYRDTAAADALLGQLSALLRRLLDHLEREEVSLAEELAFVESYLAIERARLGDRLSISVDLPAALAHCLVPPLLIQPLVENAVKHAAVPRREPSHIVLSARQTESGLELEVRDDGPGLPPGFGPERHGVGLRTTCSRLVALHGSAQGLSFESAPGGGLVARLCLPLKQSAAGPEEDA